MVDTIPDDLQRLVDSVVLDIIFPLLGQRKNNTRKAALSIFNFAGEIGEVGTKYILDLIKRVGVGKGEDDLLFVGRGGAYGTDGFLRQGFLEIICRECQSVLFSLLEIDLEHQVHAALQIEAEPETAWCQIFFPPVRHAGIKRWHDCHDGHHNQKEEQSQFELE